ncbi:hypothetical protein Tsp_07588 [Trichinella spiralis]|uniref:hypothetical protein n=1 Tax=Trichinella spiralis TaxID=6334 RepID=UPI0001EFC020|nr:hypothetical protein Tsp_07588 [Trichinella spiralis]
MIAWIVDEKPIHASYLPKRIVSNIHRARQKTTKWQFDEVKASESAQNGQCRGKRVNVSVFRSLLSHIDTNIWTIASNECNRHCKKDGHKAMVGWNHLRVAI